MVVSTAVEACASVHSTSVDVIHNSVDITTSAAAPLLVETAVELHPIRPIHATVGNHVEAVLLMADGSSVSGVSFGAETHSIAGECVFQTGMVGYPESLTDPSYRGQILVLTFPLVGNYGVPSRTSMDSSVKQIQEHFESSEIHIAALVVGFYSDDFSHYLATSSLSEWLKENNIPAISGVDTRALTKKIRTHGVLLGKLLFPKSQFPNTSFASIPANPELPCPPWISDYVDVAWEDPNLRNLVAEVSIKSPAVYSPLDGSTTVCGADGKVLSILAVDVGMKNNQIRCFVKRGVSLRVVPWNYDFISDTNYDGLFISNGPGDPIALDITIERLSKLLKSQTKPVFGICLGHQLVALASGATTSKLHFGNRGHNIPCTNQHTGRCFITSQNHGFAVNTDSLSDEWEEYFVNANDGSNEGIIHKTLPFFSVQFHPESTPGPWDTEFLFDKFIQSVKACKDAGKLVPLVRESCLVPNKRLHPRKVLVLGSGGLSIGQAGEFDYSGSQAIKALKEEGIYTVLINPNIATIQTSKGLADKVYFLPVTPEFVRKVIKHEKPDGIYCTFGGQTALNIGVKLKDEFASLGVQVLGTPIQTIEMTEDRELFGNALAEIGEKCAQSSSATTVEEAIAAANSIGYPLIIRAAYALGGLGSGFAENQEQLQELCIKAFATSPQILVEKSMKGWKEIEYEVVRDAYDNCVTVCNMENFDPLGIHTGDSIVVAPSQTLSDEDYMMLRRTAVNVIRHLGVIGECNIQYALNPLSKEYCIIEVNARLSRSSALASKATGYPLAFVAAKLGLGIPLTQVKNSVTKKTIACFEPSLDYCVVKIPRWDLKKFNRVSTKISSSMKSVGEVMAIGRNFEETIQKAIRAVDYSFSGFAENDFSEDIDEELKNPSDQRLFAVANALHKGYTVHRIWELTRIDKWFLNKLKNIVDLDKSLQKFTPSTIPNDYLRCAKQFGFSDRQIAKAISTTELGVRKIRKERGITPFVKQIDTVAAEFPCYTNYLYTTYNASEHDVTFEDKGVMVLGSGVYRIGSSVEFDWCAVRCIRTLRSLGYKTVMVNYNPETVSTDYDEADRLYFETLTLERVLDIYDIENSSGLVVCMGGQTPNNIALALHRENVKILGTSPEMIDSAENRYKFSRMCDKIGVDQPEWKELTSIDEADSFCEKVGYPVLVRPSYVLSGAAMNVVYSQADLKSYLDMAVKVSREYPVVISKFIEDAKEIEMDAIALDGKMVMHVISEHVENAGVHSGDATLVLPPQDLDPETVEKIISATQKIGSALNVTGPYNIQFIAKNNEIKVIECNVRASRSFPFVSKVIGVDLVEIATKAMLNEPFEAYPAMEDRPDYVAVKVPQFSFSRLAGADPILGVEMASTGEVACFGRDKYEAYMKALIATGFKVPEKNILLSMGSFKEKQEFLPSVLKLHELGYKLFATAGTADFLSEYNIPVKYLEALEDDSNVPQQKLEYSLTQHLANNLIDLYINLPSKNRFRRPASYMSRGYRSRRMAVDFDVPLITNIKCAKLFVEALGRGVDFEISSNDYQTSHRTIVLPGLINMQNFVPFATIPDSGHAEKITRAAAAGGFTLICNTAIGQGESAVKDRRTVGVAKKNFNGKSVVDYTFGLAANKSNVSGIAALEHDVSSLYVKLSEDATSPTTLADVAASFIAWPASRLVITHASHTQLAAVMFLANLHSRPLHITQVTKREDLALIIAGKQNGMRITCDVCVHALFLCRSTIDHPSLPTQEDMDYLWSNLDAIDCLTVGTLCSELANDDSVASGIQEALPLLLTAVYEGKLTLEYITSRLSTNPRRILDLPEQVDTYIEVEIDRKYVVPPTGYEGSGSNTSTIAGKELYGCVHRVVIRGSTIYLDGAHFGEPTGRDISGTVRISSKTAPSPSHRAVSIPTIVEGVSPRMRIFSPMDSALSPVLRTSNITVDPTASKVVSDTNALDNLLRGNALSSYKDLSDELEYKEHEAKNKKHSVIALEPSLANKYISDYLPRSVATTVVKSPFYKKHITTVLQFTRSDLHTLFGVAQEMRIIVEKQGRINLLNGKVMCSAFWEPSTRTSCSFETAMTRLGGDVVSINQITSSIAKGESISDTVRTLASYGDVIVMRHPEPGSVSYASKFSPVPIINAGDGIGEHPSQALLDIFTIREELGTVNGLTITIVGDLKNGRTVHSLVRLLTHYHVKINYVSPESLKMPESIIADLNRYDIPQYETTSLEEVLATTDVLYVTRIQKERFADLEEYKQVSSSYIITNKVMQSAKQHMIVMHPLPRVNEIDPEVDLDQRAAYFRQMRYGLFVRMALLALVVGRTV
ncbi:Carbamoyl-phosphate synthase [Batrachochytrium dendrobatidis]|nr:Carbamoyl-phosphate synthase [Batrachochytrium dendrobatidis]KAK5666475.1 Carbamoyl-phosphate synthase [Batrachochytrium dendrobatidis]